jgi:hypothetical protein
MARSQKLAVSFTTLIAHLAASFVLFGFVVPLEKAHAHTGVAGIVLKLLLFPLYAFVAATGEASSWSEGAYLTIYIGVFVFSGLLWATVITALFSLWCRARA